MKPQLRTEVAMSHTSQEVRSIGGIMVARKTGILGKKSYPGSTFSTTNSIGFPFD
jgi:hypothetical protein